MHKACFLEVLAGSLALLLGSTAAFVYSGGYYSGASLLPFVILSTLLLLAAASVLFLRVSVYHRRAAQHLYTQLPAEVVCQLKRREQLNPGIDDLIRVTGEHLSAQQSLLDEHYDSLFAQRELQGRQTTDQRTSDSENTWLQLRSELSALEDQFDTEQRINRRGYPL